MVEGIFFVVGGLAGWIAKTLLSPKRPGPPWIVMSYLQRSYDKKKARLDNARAKVEAWPRSVHVGSHIHHQRLTRSDDHGWESRSGRVVNIEGAYADIRWTQYANEQEAHPIDTEERVSIDEIERDMLSGCASGRTR